MNAKINAANQMPQVLTEIVVAFALCMGALCFFYPHHFIYFDQRFMYTHDSELHLENVAAIINHIYQGGVQLYARFDQMNNAYTLMTSGLYTVVNCLIAILFVIFKPMMPSSSELLHVLYSIFFYALPVLLRTIGGYLFLRLFTQNRLAILGGILYLNTVLTVPFFNEGMHPNNLTAYLPLMFYLILKFAQTRKFNDALLILLFGSVTVANSPFFTLSYFYVLVHFFILSVIIYTVCSKNFLTSIRHFTLGLKEQWMDRLRRGWKVSGRYRLAMLVLVAAILIPYAMLYHSFAHDFYIPNSGLQGTSGRLSGQMGIGAYFSFAGRSYAQPVFFLPAAFNFTQNQWGSTWIYLGASVFFLIVIGTIFSKVRFRGIVVLLSVFVLSLNVPAQAASWGGFAHWINVLTNPFHFLDRSFHMVALFWPCALCVLVALGIDVLSNILQARHEKYHANRLRLGAGFCFGLAGLFVSWQAGLVSMYAAVAALGTGVFLLLIPRASQAGRYILAAIIFLCLVGDFKLWHQYINHHGINDRLIAPRNHVPLAQEGEVVLDYQNPAIFPVRRYFDPSSEQIQPPIQTHQNSYGGYYHYTPLAQRFLREPHLYEPRALAYKQLHQDSGAPAYLKKDPRMVVFGKGNLQNNGAVTIDSFEDHQANRQFDLDINQVSVQGKHQVLKAYLPVGQRLEKISSSVLGPDAQQITVSLGVNRFEPAQGYLSRNWTFDLNNIKEGVLFLRIPKDVPVPMDKIKLSVLESDALLSTQRFTHDQWFFTYKAPQDGWLLLHYPYDPKWMLEIDGKVVGIRQANTYFFAAPISAGNHDVRLSYWPNTPLRVLLLLSIVLSVAAVFYVYGVSIRNFIKSL